MDEFSNNMQAPTESQSIDGASSLPENSAVGPSNNLIETLCNGIYNVAMDLEDKFSNIEEGKEPKSPPSYHSAGNKTNDKSGVDEGCKIFQSSNGTTSVGNLGGVQQQKLEFSDIFMKFADSLVKPRIVREEDEAGRIPFYYFSELSNYGGNWMNDKSGVTEGYKNIQSTGRTAATGIFDDIEHCIKENREISAKEDFTREKEGPRSSCRTNAEFDGLVGCSPHSPTSQHEYFQGRKRKSDESFDNARVGEERSMIHIGELAAQSWNEEVYTLDLDLEDKIAELKDQIAELKEQNTTLRKEMEEKDKQIQRKILSITNCVIEENLAKKEKSLKNGN